MQREPNEIRVERNADIPVPRQVEAEEPSIGELLKRVTNDTTELMRQEVALAKVEIRASLTMLVQDATKAGLGGLLNDRYWLAALIVGVVFLAIGMVLARNALSEIKRRGLVPDQTAESLRGDAAWAKREAGEVKRELTT
jgi:hypothetical protein